LWFTNRGGSGGQGPGCGTGAPPTAVFWPKYAASLAQRANFNITGPKEHLLHDGPYVAYDKQTTPRRPGTPLHRPQRTNGQDSCSHEPAATLATRSPVFRTSAFTF
jgi:hypothetical protein